MDINEVLNRKDEVILFRILPFHIKTYESDAWNNSMAMTLLS